MRDIFKGKVYPFLHPDSIESVPEIPADSDPSIYIVPSNLHPGHHHSCLTTYADVIARRKSMRQKPNSWWPGHLHQQTPSEVSYITTAQKKILDKIFIKLAGEGKVYKQEDSWFLKVDDLLPLIVEKIRSKQFMITPERHRKKYRDFFACHHQWSISENFHSGYSLPIHLCQKCRHQKISTHQNSYCDNCTSQISREGSPRFVPWFAHAGIIVEAINEGRKGNHIRTLLAIEGKDIKTIAGILILGIHFYGDIPFREIVLLENKSPSINHGSTDTSRFSLSAHPGGYRCGTLPAIDEKRLFTSFANKIWNASRFVFTHTKTGEETEVDFDVGSEVDRWFAHLLANKIEEINDLMEQYRINEAIILVLNVFQNDFCKWYLELTKLCLDNAQARATLRFTLLEFLKLFYPFLPSICQRMHNLLFQTSASIGTLDYPSFDSKMAFPIQFKKVELLKKLIQRARKTREEIGIKPGVEFRVTLYTKSKKERERIAGLIPFFNHMTGSRKTIVTGLLPQPFQTIQGEYLNWKILFSFGSDAERLQIHNRLKNEFINIAEKIEKLEAQLPSVKIKHMLQELFKRKERLKKLIHDIS